MLFKVAREPRSNTKLILFIAFCNIWHTEEMSEHFLDSESLRTRESSEFSAWKWNRLCAYVLSTVRQVYPMDCQYCLNQGD